MSKVDILYKEYNELKDRLLKNKTLNLKEDFKNKLIELDYAINSEYNAKLDSDFPMTTTLEKEENRLQKLISFIEDKSLEQKKLLADYKKVTGEVIELSYLKHTDNLRNYKERLNNVRKILAIIAEVKDISKSVDANKDVKLKVTKNRLLKKELLNLLYEFCLIDNLDIKEIEIDKLIHPNEITEVSISPKEKSSVNETPKPIELPKKTDVKVKTKKELIKPEIKKTEIKSNINISKENIIKEPEVKLKKEVVKPEVKKQEIVIEKQPEIKNNISINKENVVKAPEIKVKKEVVKPVEPLKEEPREKQEEKVLTSMPIVDKIGSVVPVNVFESLQKTEEKIPDVVLPSNGLKDDQNDIFVDTTNMFGEEEKK